MPGNYLRYVDDIRPTILNNDAYDSGDVIFNPTACPMACPAVNQPSYLVSLTIYDLNDNAAADMRILVMKASTEIGTLDSAPNLADVSATDIMHNILIASADWHDMGGFKMVNVDLTKLPRTVRPATGTTTIYFAGITGGTPTYTTAAGLTLVPFFQDVYPF